MFRDRPVGFYCAQLDLKKSLSIAAEHLCVAHIFKDWKQCTDSKQRFAIIIDNQGRGDYVQKGDVEDLTSEHTGDTIFSLSLQLENSQVTSIIKLKRRTTRNSAYLQASETESLYLDRRITRQCRSPKVINAIATSEASSGGKKCGKRGKRGSGKQRKTINKNNEKVIAKHAKSNRPASDLS